MSGVVDWQAASIGPCAADVWHCRGNLLGQFGLDAADRFVEMWQSVTAEAYHPWAQAVMLVDAIGWLEDHLAHLRTELEHLLAHSLAELGA